MPVRRKGGGPETTLLRDHRKTVDYYEKEKKRNKASLVSRLSGNLITSSYLNPGSLPSLSSMGQTAFAACYTCHRSSGGAAVVTGRSVEVAVGVGSDVV